MVYIIPDLLVIHFAENFMKIQTKIAKLQMHEILHKNVNENKFSFTFLYIFLSFYEATNMLQRYTSNFLYPWFLINLKLRSSSFRLHQVFPTVMVQMLFSQIQQALALISER